MAFKVNSEQCKTCIFGKQSSISPARFQELKAVWESQGVVQECHQFTIKHQQVACRGHYEAARRGSISHPIVQTAEQALGLAYRAMGLPEMSTADVMQVCERMGLVEFVEDE